MRKLYILILLIGYLLFSVAGSAQDFSNKGKEFWLCFPNHIPSNNNPAKMALFITSNKNSSGTISVHGFNTTFTVTANQICGTIDIPYSNAHITGA